MGKVAETTIEKRSAIITLIKEGKSQREVASQLKISKGCVQRAIERHAQTGLLEDKPRSGRPRSTTKQEDLLIVTTSKRNRRKTAPEIRSEINITRNKPLSLTTVKRRLRDAGLFGRVAVRKPLLRPQNKVKRLEWAKRHRDWTEEDFSRVLWSDESKFEVFGTKRRVFVRRSAEQKMLPDCMVPTVKHGGGSVMVWGCFSSSGVGDLTRVSGKMNKEAYKKILEENALISGLRLIGEGFVFQQDNDPKHTSRLCQDYLKQREDEEILQVMTWPPQSPDINPIELLWEELDRRVRDQCPSSESALWNTLQGCWNNIPHETIQKLVARLPRIVKKVIECKGGFFDEKSV